MIKRLFEELNQKITWTDKGAYGGYKYLLTAEEKELIFRSIYHEARGKLVSLKRFDEPRL